MPDERQQHRDRQIDPFYPPPPARRGSFFGGPGIIFVFLMLLILAGIGIYGASIGALPRWVEAMRNFDVASIFNQTAMEPTPSAEQAAATPAVGDGPLVLTPMGPAELLTKRNPPKSLRLTAAGFDKPPVERFARPALFLGQKPRLSFIVVNLGHNKAVTAAAIADTPPEVTLSFSPYAPELAAWIDAAHAFGHEVMIDLPLESRAYPQEDPGDLGLLTALNPDENQRRLDALMQLADGAAGFATQRGDRFLTTAAPLRPVLESLGDNGFGLVVASTGGNALAEARNGASALPPSVIANIELAHDLSRQAITEKLDAALRLATRNGKVLVVVQPYPLGIAALTQMAPFAKARNLALVPATALLVKE